MVFNFMDPVSDLKSKEIKRACLNELVDYVTATRGVLTEPVYPEIVFMVVLFLLHTQFPLCDSKCFELFSVNFKKRRLVVYKFVWSLLENGDVYFCVLLSDCCKHFPHIAAQ